MLERLEKHHLGFIVPVSSISTIEEKYEKLGNDLINEKLITRIDFRYSTTRSVNIKEFSDWLETKLRIDSEYNLK